MTLTAQWEIWTYTVTKYPISTESGYDVMRNVEWGHKLTEDELRPEDGPGEGYAFVSWYTSPVGG